MKTRDRQLKVLAECDAALRERTKKRKQQFLEVQDELVQAWMKLSRIWQDLDGDVASADYPKHWHSFDEELHGVMSWAHTTKAKLEQGATEFTKQQQEMNDEYGKHGKSERWFALRDAAEHSGSANTPEKVEQLVETLNKLKAVDQECCQDCDGQFDTLFEKAQAQLAEVGKVE